jgi:hypothetical protein
VLTEFVAAYYWDSQWAAPALNTLVVQAVQTLNAALGLVTVLEEGKHLPATYPAKRPNARKKLWPMVPRELYISGDAQTLYTTHERLMLHLSVDHNDAGFVGGRFQTELEGMHDRKHSKKGAGVSTDKPSRAHSHPLPVKICGYELLGIKVAQHVSKDEGETDDGKKAKKPKRRTS